MLIVLSATIVYQIIINYTYQPLAKSLLLTYSDTLQEPNYKLEQSHGDSWLGNVLSQSEILNTLFKQFLSNEALYLRKERRIFKEYSLSDDGEPNNTSINLKKEDENKIKDIILNSDMTIWIPKDSLGISDDEILQIKKKN